VWPRRIVVVEGVARLSSANPAMPAPRLVLILLFVLAHVTCGAAAAPTDTVPERPATPPTTIRDETATVPIEFYLAHGEANACGPGCNEWIAAEGKVDFKAAQKLHQLVAKLKGRQPPIFFHSPGGSVDGAIALGRYIHRQKLTTTVGRTVPVGCKRDKPLEDSCVALKRSGQSGQAVEAEIDSTVAMCNSACVYLVAAGTVRRVPPWVKVGIHDVARDPSRMMMPGRSEAEEKRIAYGRIRYFLRDVGAEESLLAAAAAVPANSLKLLQRDDMVRFGIDRREFGETVWEFADKPAPVIRKRFFVHTDSEKNPYIDGVMAMNCGLGANMGVVFGRQPLASEPASQSEPSTLSIADKSVRFGPAKSNPLYTRVALVPMNTFDAVADASTIVVPGRELGRKDDATLSMDGFSAAHAKLRKMCAEARIAQSMPNWPTNSPSTPSVWPGAQTVLPNAPAVRPGTPWPTTSTSQTPAAPQAESMPHEITEMVASGQKLRVAFLYSIQPNCSPVGQIAVRVLEQPEHGTLTIEDGKDFTLFSNDNPRAACNTAKSDGTLVVYRPNHDYLGTTRSASLSAILPATPRRGIT
jgi:hypothetical protein